MSLTAQEKYIYNTHLKVTRSQAGKPWRPRKDFSNISLVEEEYLKKINSNVIKYNIDIENYFQAPYKLWGDTSHKPLEYFTKFKAVKTYRSWIEKLLFEDPEHEIIVNLIKNGFYFIYNRCKELKLKNVEQFFEHKTYYPEFLIALQEQKITYYNILSVSNYETVLKNYIKEDIDFIVPNYYNNINSLRSRYYRSEKLKKLNNKIIKKLNKILNYVSI